MKISFPRPDTLEDIIDAGALFEQCAGDSYLENGGGYSDLKLARKYAVENAVSAFDRDVSANFTEYWDIIQRWFDEWSHKPVMPLSFKDSAKCFTARPKIPECRAYKPVCFENVIRACKDYANQANGIHMVIGARTSGSWGGPILTAALRHNKIPASYFSVRPIRGLELKYGGILDGVSALHGPELSFLMREEEWTDFSKSLRELISQKGTVVIVDDPPDTGRTVEGLAQDLRRLGVDNIVFLCLGSFNRQAIQGVDSIVRVSTDGAWFWRSGDTDRLTESLCGSQIGMFPQSVYEAVPRNTNIGIKVWTEDAYTKHFGKFVGLGWFGKLEEHRGKILKSFTPAITGLIDGYLFTRWVDQPLLKTDLTELWQDAAAYAVSVTENYTVRLSAEGIPLVWHTNAIGRHHWLTDNQRLLRAHFEGGHWARLQDCRSVLLGFCLDASVCTNTAAMAMDSFCSMTLKDNGRVGMADLYKAFAGDRRARHAQKGVKKWK